MYVDNEVPGEFTMALATVLFRGWPAGVPISFQYMVAGPNVWHSGDLNVRVGRDPRSQWRANSKGTAEPER